MFKGKTCCFCSHGQKELFDNAPARFPKAVYRTYVTQTDCQPAEWRRTPEWHAWVSPQRW